MAINRHLYKDLKVSQPYLVDIVGQVAIGGTGAVGTASGKGFTVTRTGVGLYTIKLNGVGALPKILFADLAVISTSGNYAALVRTFDATNRLLTLATCDYAVGVVNTDPPSGGVLMFRITVQNANVS